MGCKTTKHASQPGSKPGKAGQVPDKTGRHHTPVKSPMKSIKELPPAELAKHKESDIISFVRNGNLAMIHGLIKHYRLEESVMNLRAPPDEFGMLQGQKVSTRDWNPLLIAIASKKIDVVQYFLGELKISLRQLGRQPGEEEFQTEELAAEQHLFCLKIAVATKDLLMLEELWNHYTAWDTVHLQLIIDVIIQERWGLALQSILKSYTTDVIFSSMTLARQVEIVEYLFRQRKGTPVEFHKYFDESISRKPFALVAIHVILDNSNEGLYASQEIRAFIEKAHLDISEYEYGHLRYSPYNTVLRQRIQHFETLGDPEKASMKRLTELFDKHEATFTTHRYFNNEHEYDNLEIDLLKAYLDGDHARIQEIAESTDLRRVPLAPGYNHQLRYPELNNHACNYWPIPLHMLFAQQVSEATMIEFLHTVIFSGFNVRQALRIQSHRDRDDQVMPRIPEIDGAALLIALERNEFEVFRYLLGEDFINVWGIQHLNMIISVVARERFYGTDMMGIILNSPVTKNIFLAFPDFKKYEFVRNIHIMFSHEEPFLSQTRLGLSQRPYAPYLLVQLIEKDQFRKLTDFSPYLNSLNSVSKYELEELSLIPRNEEIFMNFLRYVSLLDPSDPRKVEGQKLIERIFEIQKYQAIKGQSLAIFDHESQILEEEGVDEHGQRTNIHSMAPHQKIFARDFDINIVHSYIKDGMQTSLIEYLRSYKLTDIMFLRGSPSEFHSIYRMSDNRLTFSDAVISDSNFNLLQLAVLNGHYDLVKYIMFEHKIFSNTRQSRQMDPRIILLNHDLEDDETLTIRLAIQSGNVEIFKIFWDYYPQLYTETHLLAAARFCLFLRRYEYLVHLLASPTSTPIFLSSPVSARVEFVDLFDELTLEQIPDRTAIIQILGQEPYTKLDKQVSDDRLLQIYNYIRLNEVDHLREIISSVEIQGVAHLLFDFFEDDDEVLPLAEDSRITVSFLNPILLAVKSKSFDCLTYLVSKFGLRQSMRSYYLNVRTAKRDLPFRNLLIPLILKSKDNDMLSFLLKHEGFVMTSFDFSSFIIQSLQDRWLQGLRTFLWSNAAQFFFSTLTWEEQRINVDRIVRIIGEHDEPKLRQTYVASILEETITKRPYAKHLTLLLLQGDLMYNLDGARLARECLKNLTGEDFMQLWHLEGSVMMEYERAYPNIQGALFENELAKIMLRYNNEGKSSIYAANQRKQVTFQERQYEEQL